MITESDALAKAIDDAANLWPDIADERAEILRRLIERGIESVETEVNEKLGIWPENYLEELRSEWPA
jgi:precorrin-6B methylase 1